MVPNAYKADGDFLKEKSTAIHLSAFNINTPFEPLSEPCGLPDL
jgi:hypothetical protein